VGELRLSGGRGGALAQDTLSQLPTAALASEYSSIAKAYANLWSPIIRPMAQPLFKRIDLDKAETVLDIGTGTGAMLPDIRAAANQALIVGLDRSEGMLRHAQRVGFTTAAISHGQELCIRSQSVDVALLIFVLFHYPDPVAGLREVRRVLRKGGRAGITVWGNDPGTPGATIWTEELNREEASPDPRDPSIMQADAMNSLEKLESLVSSSGLEVVELWSERFSHRFTMDHLLKMQLGCGIAARRLASLDAEARVRCTHRVTERLAELSEDELDYRPEVLFAVIRGLRV
jgi:ubiquinone/menaquinone biosynthesis C-methylase UbiE